jgi:hypothetical protein
MLAVGYVRYRPNHLPGLVVVISEDASPIVKPSDMLVWKKNSIFQVVVRDALQAALDGVLVARLIVGVDEVQNPVGADYCLVVAEAEQRAKAGRPLPATRLKIPLPNADSGDFKSEFLPSGFRNLRRCHAVHANRSLSLTS